MIIVQITSTSDLSACAAPESVGQQTGKMVEWLIMEVKRRQVENVIGFDNLKINTG